MGIFHLFLAVLLQAPAPPQAVVVGLTDGQEIVVENPEFTGFIQGRSSDAVLTYRQKSVHGRMPTNMISRIEFGKYERSKPFPMTVILKNGQVLQVLSEGRNYLTLGGNTTQGIVRIQHPDPISAPLKLTTRKPNRKKDLTIQYLEFPAPSE
jgi:hypothetical protein